MKFDYCERELVPVHDAPIAFLEGFPGAGPSTRTMTMIRDQFVDRFLVGIVMPEIGNRFGTRFLAQKSLPCSSAKVRYVRHLSVPSFCTQELIYIRSGVGMPSTVSPFFIVVTNARASRSLYPSNSPSMMRSLA